MAVLYSPQLWLPPSSLSCDEEFDYWAARSLAANGLWMDFCAGFISFEDYVAGCEHHGVDVDDFLSNIDAELCMLGV